MVRLLLLVTLMVLLFLQITTINAKQKRSHHNGQWRTKEEYLQIICGDDKKWCTRAFQDFIPD